MNIKGRLSYRICTFKFDKEAIIAEHEKKGAIPFLYRKTAKFW